MTWLAKAIEQAIAEGWWAFPDESVQDSLSARIERARRFILLCWSAGERARARIWAHRMTALVKERNRLEAVAQ